MSDARDEIDERTIVSDATVVRPIDRTVVRTRGIDDASATPAQPADELTVVRPVIRPPHRDAAEDATIVRALEDTLPRAAAPAPRTMTAPVAAPHTPAAPGEETMADRALLGLPPWELGPEPERGVRPGLPVVYGARGIGVQPTADGFDTVASVLGPAPEVATQMVRADRAALPSMERRALRESVLLLGGAAAACVVSVLGLWFVARIAFG